MIDHHHQNHHRRFIAIIMTTGYYHHPNEPAAGLLGDKLSYLPGVQQEPLYERRLDTGEIFSKFFLFCHSFLLRHQSKRFAGQEPLYERRADLLNKMPFGSRLGAGGEIRQVMGTPPVGRHRLVLNDNIATISN